MASRRGASKGGGGGGSSAVRAALERNAGASMAQLLQRVEPMLTAEAADDAAASITRAAAEWRRTKLAHPAVLAAVVAEQLVGEELRPRLHALSRPSSVYPRPGPVARVVALALRLLSEPIDIDEGVILPLPEVDPVLLAHSLVAWLVVRLNVAVGDLEVDAARGVWARAELHPDHWAGRIKRLAEEYEKKTYPGGASS